MTRRRRIRLWLRRWWLNRKIRVLSARLDRAGGVEDARSLGWALALAAARRARDALPAEGNG